MCHFSPFKRQNGPQNAPYKMVKHTLTIRRLLKQFIGCCQRIVSVCLTILQGAFWRPFCRLNGEKWHTNCSCVELLAWYSVYTPTARSGGQELHEFVFCTSSWSDKVVVKDGTWFQTLRQFIWYVDNYLFRYIAS